MLSLNSHFTYEETEARAVTSVMKLQVSGPTAPRGSRSETTGRRQRTLPPLMIGLGHRNVLETEVLRVQNLPPNPYPKFPWRQRRMDMEWFPWWSRKVTEAGSFSHRKKPPNSSHNLPQLACCSSPSHPRIVELSTLAVSTPSPLLTAIPLPSGSWLWHTGMSGWEVPGGQEAEVGQNGIVGWQLDMGCYLEKRE